jgi:hypothetical protein
VALVGQVLFYLLAGCGALLELRGRRLDAVRTAAIETATSTVDPRRAMRGAA